MKCSMADDILRRERSSLPRCRLPVLLVVFHLLASLHDAQGFVNLTASLSTSWKITPGLRQAIRFSDGSQVRASLLRRNRDGQGPAHAFGFYCEGACNIFLLGIFIIRTNGDGDILDSPRPQVVWAANRGRPVGQNATLQLGFDGDLVLTDADGTKVWFTGTSGKSVAGLNLTEYGNLVLFGGDKNLTIWESFDYPTDSLVPGQRLRVGQSLTANVSATNGTAGLYCLSANSNGLIPFIKTDPPTRYASILARRSDSDADGEEKYFEFMNSSIFTTLSGRYMPPSNFLRLESDGHVRVYEWKIYRWEIVHDLLSEGKDATCLYPTVCGRYGICLHQKEQCVCPLSDGGNKYFDLFDSWNPSLGCREFTPLSCQTPYNHSLLRLGNISYFADHNPVDYEAISGIDEDGCRNACAKNCSCKAAFFRYHAADSIQIAYNSCYPVSEVFSLMHNQDNTPGPQYSIAFIKVQIPANSTSPSSSAKGSETAKILGSTSPSSSAKGSETAKILGSAFAALFSLLLVIVCCLLIARKIFVERRDVAEEDDEDDLQQLSGMPRRFCFAELRVATDSFSKKLGQGGFGSVYEGRVDGRTVAVKSLDGGGPQGRKEFLAEVQTIGKIHHVNLVKVIGYCVEKSCRLLVYEFMRNGSLDRWIFSKHPTISLDWKTRSKIILGVAKGLSYLHEDCSQRIAHLDIKPQNILLDDRFEAKVSDFGLAKLIDKDRTHVETRMRGTPGYLAPEWLSSKITEKADVYSFGVVVLEIICGRKNLDRCQPEVDTTLVSRLKMMARNGEMLDDLVDECFKKTGRFHVEEARKMMKVCWWCLQDENERPSMSTVVKALEGVIDVENLEENLRTSSALELEGANASSSSNPLLASVLSGPR